MPGCSETGVRGSIKSGALRADSWRCQSLQEMFSRRLPSWRDSLHLVKTGTGEKGDGAKRRDILVQRWERVSPPSRSLRASAARARTGDGKFETMRWNVRTVWSVSLIHSTRPDHRPRESLLPHSTKNVLYVHQSPGLTCRPAFPPRPFQLRQALRCPRNICPSIQMVSTHAFPIKYLRFVMYYMYLWQRF